MTSPAPAPTHSPFTFTPPRFKGVPEGACISVGLRLVPAPSETARCAAVVNAFDPRTRRHHVLALAVGAGTDNSPIDFLPQLAALRQTYPAARWCTQVAGTEKGLADFIRTCEGGVPMLEFFPVVGSHFTRLQPYLQAWQEGRVLVPAAEAEWVTEFLAQHEAFRLFSRGVDHVIDAALTAHGCWW